MPPLATRNRLSLKDLSRAGPNSSFAFDMSLAIILVGVVDIKMRFHVPSYRYYIVLYGYEDYRDVGFEAESR